MRNGRKKLENLIFYHGIAILAVTAAVAAAVFLLRDLGKQRPADVFYVMVAGLQLEEGAEEVLQEGLTRALGLDNQTQQCVVETAYGGRANMQSEATAFAYLQSGRVDLLLAPEEVFNRYAVTGYLTELETGSFSGALADREKRELFFASQADYSKGGAVDSLAFHPHEDTDDARVYGVYCKEGVFGGCVAGVLANCPNKAYVEAGLQYVLDGF